MTSKTEQKISRWLPVLLMLAINIATVGYIIGTHEQRLQKVEEHAADTRVHMPYVDKIREFLPRSEYNSDEENELRTFERIMHQLDRIEDKLDAINKDRE